MDYGQIIFNELINQGIPSALANLITAQAAHETDGYTSNVFLHCNNAFGYKWRGQSYAQGSCLLSPEGDYYAAYGSIQQSAQELAAWIYRRQDQGIFPADLSTITTPYQYSLLLQESQYFTDNLVNYTNGLTKWFKAYGAPVIAVGSIVTLISWGFLAYRLFKKSKS